MSPRRTSFAALGMCLVLRPLNEWGDADEDHVADLKGLRSLGSQLPECNPSWARSRLHVQYLALGADGHYELRFHGFGYHHPRDRWC